MIHNDTTGLQHETLLLHVTVFLLFLYRIKNQSVASVLNIYTLSPFLTGVSHKIVESHKQILKLDKLQTTQFQCCRSHI